MSRFDIEEVTEQVSEAVRQDAALIEGYADEAFAEQSETYYRELAVALHALHSKHPADLSGSDVLATLYRLAKLLHGDVERKVDAEIESRVNAQAARHYEARIYGRAA